MNRISSSLTPLLKWGFPTVWFTMVASALVTVVRLDDLPKSALPITMLVTMGLFGFGICWLVLWSAVDEVHDGGEELLVRKGRIQDRIPLAHVAHVGGSRQNGPRVMLRLSRPSRLGTDILFWASDESWIGFGEMSIVRELRARAEDARKPAT